MRLHELFKDPDIKSEDLNFNTNRVWQIQWAVTEDNSQSNNPQYIFAKNRSSAMKKFADRFSSNFGNVQIETIKEVNWNSVVKEGDVIHSKFGQKLGQKKGMYHNPDLEPPVDRKTGEPFARFYMRPGRSSNTGTIVGVKENGQEVDVGTSTKEVAEVLTRAYNAGGYTDKEVRKVPLKSMFKGEDNE